MKKIKGILAVILLFTMIASGCVRGGQTKVIPKGQVDDITNTGIRDQSQWQEYENSRFGYSIRFPKAWYKGNSSKNNDGIVLHVDSDFDIRAYGANYTEGTSKPYSNLDKEGFKKSDIKLNKGQTAVLITGQENNMSIYEMVFVAGSVEYHFYAKVSKDYAEEYGDVIIDVIKTFNPSLEGEAKQPGENNSDNNNNDGNNDGGKDSDTADTIEEIIKEKEQKVINAIDQSNMDELAKYVHPEKGVRFTPYSYVSLTNDLVFKKNQISDFMENTNEYLWGYYDGSGFEIKSTPKKYWNEFVYDRNFKDADQKSYNEIIGKSSALENQFTIYPNSIIVEYYMAPVNPDFGGMDWESLRLVFEKFNNEWYLVGIIHNQHVI